MSTERKPLLSPGQVNDAHRLSRPTPSFPKDPNKSERPGMTERSSSLHYISLPGRPAETPSGNWTSWLRGGDEDSGLPGPVTQKGDNGLPKLSRECISAETWCYLRNAIIPVSIFGIITFCIAFLVAGAFRH